MTQGIDSIGNRPRTIQESWIAIEQLSTELQIPMCIDTDGCLRFPLAMTSQKCVWDLYDEIYPLIADKKRPVAKNRAVVVKVLEVIMKSFPGCLVDFRPRFKSAKDLVSTYDRRK
jgi:hypothetical protein